MFKSFALVALAGVASAVGLESVQYGEYHDDHYDHYEPEYKADYKQYQRPAYKKPAYEPKYVKNAHGYVPYSTSYAEPAKTSCSIAPYKPELIKR